MTHLQAIVIAILQGVSELFPVSSLGHAVVLPRLLHWGLNEKSDTWLAFLVALHLGTAAALLIYFRGEWVDVVKAFVRSIKSGQMSQDHDERLAWMVILGTIPAGVVGLALQNPLRSLFATPSIAASFLIVNGLIMYAGEQLLQHRASEDEWLRSQQAREEALRPTAGGAAVTVTPPRGPDRIQIGRYRDITQVGWRDAAIVGFAQVGALIPGISRSGITMVAGLAAGLTHEAAARYTFLLATPIIGAAGVLEIPQLFTSSGRSVLGDAILGMFLAGIAAYLSVRFLMRYFQVGRLNPFAYYCVLAGAGSLLWMTVS
ncbi:MAG TPA: undecaprenyl-diphosphate phosphatase [Chloroflexota bacterium]|nr:undecaprenyl-diphosphate phosphatase [Chloroflexota bacterium]